MDWKTLFLSAEGRIGRRDFWIGFLMLLAASIVVNLIPLIGGVIGLLLIWPQICLHAKRLHDMGRTAWLLLIPGALSVASTIVLTVLGVVAAFSGDVGAISAAAYGMIGLVVAVVMVVGLAFLFWVGLTPSEPGENRFGPPARQLIGEGAQPQI
jgi:uncharacterized membrane protein YhaH (DUF805 family)